ncbi:MAG TPA: hypothetical protein VFS94_12085 [Gemmatimonadales bacterium]|nr:hypothetical protein [Gemmatimonadales bacterium]
MEVPLSFSCPGFRGRRCIGAIGLGGLLLTACEGLGRRPAPPASAVQVADTTPALEPSARRAARQAEKPTSRNYPSAADVADGPIGLRQVDSPPPRPAPPPRSTAPRLDLENLATAQEQHFANNARYASNLSYLTLRLVPRPGVTVRIESASDSGWTGRSTLDGWSGSSCVVWVGRVGTRPATDRDRITPARSGTVVCDSL